MVAGGGWPGGVTDGPTGATEPGSPAATVVGLAMSRPEPRFVGRAAGVAAGFDGAGSPAWDTGSRLASRRLTAPAGVRRPGGVTEGGPGIAPAEFDPVSEGAPVSEGVPLSAGTPLSAGAAVSAGAPATGTPAAPATPALSGSTLPASRPRLVPRRGRRARSGSTAPGSSTTAHGASGPRMSASSRASRVSFSTSSWAMRSRVGRWWVSTARARSWASSINRRISRSMVGRHLLGVVGLVAELPAQEDLPARLAQLLGAERVAHAVLGDHGPGDVGDLLDVVLGPGGRLGEDELLGGAPAEAHGHGVAQLAAGVVVAVLGKGEGQAERPAAGDDRHLVDRDRRACRT